MTQSRFELIKTRVALVGDEKIKAAGGHQKLKVLGKS